MVSKGGKITISVVVVVLIVAVAWITWCIWKKRFAESKLQNIKLKPTLTKETCVPIDEIDEDDDESYKECDYGNLGLHHSTLNVHKCRSGACKNCNPVGEAPSVRFVRVVKQGEAGKDGLRNKFFALFQQTPKENHNNNHPNLTVIPTDIDGEHESVEIEP